MQTQLQQRQRSACSQPSIDECSEHITEVFVVGCAEEKAVNISPGLVPCVHQATEPESCTGKSENSASAGPISGGVGVRGRWFWLEHLDAFD
jgi:hypothetical protein